MDKIEELLTRGVDTVYPTTDALEKALRGGKKLTLYQGFDPTGIQMHIGHMVGFRKLAQFQKLGHHVIFLIGDGTGLAGDPSGKTRAREKFLSRDELRANALDYVKQASKLVNFEGENAVEIKYNGDWLTKLTLQDILEIAGNFTLQQLEERDLFEKRKQSGEPINMREFMYPLLQGYDSVAMNVDLELGGSDQMFNMLAGRTLVQNMLRKEKFVMTTPLLTDSEGRKIGKTEGNVIALNDTPEKIFGDIMNLPDEIVIKGLEYLTDIPMQEIHSIDERINNGANPQEFKMLLATEVIKQLTSEKDAQRAKVTFENSIRPTADIFQISFPTTLVSGATIIDGLTELQLATSRSEAKNLVNAGGTAIITNESGQVKTSTIKNPSDLLPTGEYFIRVGKKPIVKVKKEE